MKTTILLAILFSVSIFFQKKIQSLDFNFSINQMEQELEINQMASNQSFQIQTQNLISPPTDISQNSLSIIFHFVKVTFLPIVGVVLMMWMMMSLGIFNSLKILKK